MHAANVGKIVFSTQKIDRTNPDPSLLANSFADTDRIYGRFYLPSAIANHFAVWSDGDGSTYLATGYEILATVAGEAVNRPQINGAFQILIELPWVVAR